MNPRTMPWLSEATREYCDRHWPLDTSSDPQISGRAPPVTESIGTTHARRSQRMVRQQGWPNRLDRLPGYTLLACR